MSASAQLAHRAPGANAARLSLSMIDRPHAFIKVMTAADARDDAEFDRHRLLEDQRGRRSPSGEARSPGWSATSGARAPAACARTPSLLGRALDPAADRIGVEARERGFDPSGFRNQRRRRRRRARSARGSTRARLRRSPAPLPDPAGPRSACRRSQARARPCPRRWRASPSARGRRRAVRRAGQQTGRADIREEPNADLRHGEYAALARHAKGAVHRKPDAAAHNDAVDKCYKGFRISFDASVEDVFFTPEGQLRGVIARPALIVQLADIAARAERSPACAGDDDAFDCRIAPRTHRARWRFRAPWSA